MTKKKSSGGLILLIAVLGGFGAVVYGAGPGDRGSHRDDPGVASDAGPGCRLLAELGGAVRSGARERYMRASSASRMPRLDELNGTA